MELWVHQRRNGPSMESVLFKHTRRIMCSVGCSLTLENKYYLERTQKNFCKLVLEENFSTYHEALAVLGLQNLTERRQKLALDFARRSISDDILKDLFLIKRKRHEMATRNTEQYRVNHANTNRYKNSPLR